MLNPTIGLQIETLELEDIKLYCWDVGGADKIWPLWIGFIESLDNYSAVVLVVDLNDRDRTDPDLRMQLDRFLNTDSSFQRHSYSSRCHLPTCLSHLPPSSPPFLRPSVSPSLCLFTLSSFPPFLHRSVPSSLCPFLSLPASPLSCALPLPRFSLPARYPSPPLWSQAPLVKRRNPPGQNTGSLPFWSNASAVCSYAGRHGRFGTA